MKRLRTLAATVALGAVVAPLATAVPAAAQAADGAVVRPICFPVEGGTSGATWTDSFGDPRGGGTRSHEGQDLMSVGAQKGRRILSAVDGTVREIVYDNNKGNRLVVQDDEGWFYVYIHLNNDTPGTDDALATRDQAFAAGLEEGDRVSRCEHVAFMGDSGNAEGTSPHLHFEIREPVASTSSWAWSSAPAINPHDSLLAATGSAPRSNVTSGDRWRPFASASALVERQYLDFYGRRPDSAGAAYWTNRLNSGADTATSFIGRLLSAPEFEARIAPVARLYWAYFDRIPDTAGLTHWVERTSNGATLGEVSQAFAGSAEFQARYGSLANADFVELVYENVLGRAPDSAGRDYWTARLDRDELDRGEVMIGFSESPEYAAALASKVRVVLAYVAMLQRSPDQAGLDHWAAQGANGLVAGVYVSDEYRARIAGL